MDTIDNANYDADMINQRSHMVSTSEPQNQRSLGIKDSAKILEKLEDRFSYGGVVKTNKMSPVDAERIEKEKDTILSIKRILGDDDDSRPLKKKSARKVRRQTCSDDERTKLIALLEGGLPVRSVAMAFNVSTRVVSKMKRNKGDNSAHEKSVDGCNPSTSMTKGKSTVNSGLDRSLQQWYMQKRSLGMPVSDDDLKHKALVFNVLLNGPNSLRVNNLWLHKFRARYRLGDSLCNDEASSGNGEASIKFYEEFSEHLRSNGYSPERVYNAVETSITWKTLPDRFIDTHGEKERLSDHRVTIMICSNATGTHKLPLMVIGKETNPRCFRAVKINPVIYKSQRDAWMDDKLFTEWYKEIFLSAIAQRHGDNNEKCILLLDNAVPHRPKQPLNSMSNAATVMYLPLSVAPIVQPLNQGIVDKTKRAYKMNLFRQVLLDDGLQTPAELLKSLTMLFFCNYIASAWESVTENDLTNAWRQIFPREEAPACENEHLSAKFFFKMLRQIPNRGHVTAGEMNSWLSDNDDPGWKILSDDEILASACNNVVDEIKTEIKEEVDTIEDAVAIDDDQGFVPSASDALIGCNYVEGWIQNRPECTQEHLAVLRELREFALEVSLAEKESHNET